MSVRPPRIRALSFHLIPTSFTPTIPNSYGTLICLAISSMVKCLIWSFLYVRSDVCRQLLSDSTSQWTSLLLAIQFPLLGLTRDLHPLDNAHAERTKIRKPCRGFLIWRALYVSVWLVVDELFFVVQQLADSFVERWFLETAFHSLKVSL